MQGVECDTSVTIGSVLLSILGYLDQPENEIRITVDIAVHTLKHTITCIYIHQVIFQVWL